MGSNFREGRIEAIVQQLLLYPEKSQKEIAESLGIDPSHLSRLKKRPEFQTKMQEALKKQWRDAERIAQKTVIDLAGEKNLQAATYILDSLNYKTENINIKNNEVKIKITEEEE